MPKWVHVPERAAAVPGRAEGCGEGRGSPGGAGGLCGGGREARALRGKGDLYGVRIGKPWDLEALGSMAGTLRIAEL